MAGIGAGPWIEVDVGAIVHNIKALRARIGVPVVGVAKCDGYGHGLVPVAKAMHQGGAEGVGVGGLEESRAVRTALPRTRVFDLFPAPAPVDSAADEYVRLGVEKAVASRPEIEALATAARRARSTAEVHLKVDTGLRRLGVEPHAAEKLLLLVATLPQVRLTGIFTTLAERDPEEARGQIRTLRELGAKARKLGLEPDLHASSTASMDLADARLDLVRVGLASYGVGAERPLVGFASALSLRAPVLSVRGVPALEHVGYGTTYRTIRRTLVATLGIGSADGLPRALSNRGAVIIGGSVRPMIGRVSLNHCLVDPGRRWKQESASATLIGTEGRARITVEDVARAAGTSPYEILVRLSARLERRYYKRGRLIQVRKFRDEYRDIAQD